MYNKLLWLLGTLALFFTVNSFAIQSPYPTWTVNQGNDGVLNATEFTRSIGAADGKLHAYLPSQESSNACATAHATYDFDVDGGSIGTKASAVYLPANALIKQTYFHVKTSFVSALDGRTQVYCEDSMNIKTAVATSAFLIGTVVAGESDGAAASTFKDDIAARCEISVAISSGALTAGYLDIYVDYCAHN